MRKLGLLIILVCGLQCAKAQVDDVLATCDSVFKYKNFIVFKRDTFNRLNAESKKEGKWLDYEEWEMVTATTLLNSNRTTVDTSLCGVILYTGQYKSDVQQGIWQYYYYDGPMILRAQIPYVNGLVVGEVRSYYKNGGLKMHATAKPGEQNVTCKEYDEQGKLLRTSTKNLAVIVKDLIGSFL